LFRNWTDRLVILFFGGGMSEDSAHRMATMTITATEGAAVSDLVRYVT